MSGLSDLHVIETLDGYGFTNRSPAPWRGEDPDQWQSYPVDVSDLPDFARSDSVLYPPAERYENRGSWEAVGERVDGVASRPERLPPPGPVEALAWYLPFHYYGPDWGIYIKESEIIRIAGFIKQRLGGGRSTSSEVQQLCRMALSVLYLHEAFHHKVESFATRLEIARLSVVYLKYESNVYRPLLGTDELLEEALACSEMCSRLRNEKSFHGNVDLPIKAAALQFLSEWIPSLPPGYRRGLDFQIKGRVGTLLSQVAEARVKPDQPPTDWDIANHMIRGLFNKNEVAHVVVPIGEDPVIPWLGAERFLAISTREVERLITRDFGYVDTGRGKGSHRHFHCRGRNPITLPSNRESLSPGVQRQVAKALGFGTIRELAAHC